MADWLLRRWQHAAEDVFRTADGDWSVVPVEIGAADVSPSSGDPHGQAGRAVSRSLRLEFALFRDNGAREAFERRHAGVRTAGWVPLPARTEVGVSEAAGAATGLIALRQAGAGVDVPVLCLSADDVAWGRSVGCNVLLPQDDAGLDAMLQGAAGLVLPETRLDWRSALVVATALSLGVPLVVLGAELPEDWLDEACCQFVRDGRELAVVAAALGTPALRALWGAEAQRCAERLRRRNSRLAGLLSGWRRLGGDEPRKRLVVAGHDFKFFTQIAAELETFCNIEIAEDKWLSHGRNDPPTSQRALAEADVIFCEWCLGNAVWYSRNKRPGQRLVVRFHAQEWLTAFPEKVDASKVDQFIFVGEHYARDAVSRYGWPEDKVSVVGNSVDGLDLFRPKTSAAVFTLGMLQHCQKLKRLDRALDILEGVRAVDSRYRLTIKGKQPWEYPWVWNRDEELRFFEKAFDRIRSAPLLRDAVEFAGFGKDVGAWFRRVGFLLSTSDRESFHLAVAEGAASGAVPLIIDRPGASDVFPERWIYQDVSQVVDAILRINANGDVDEVRDSCAVIALQSFDRAAIGRRFAEILGLDR